ncbi:MAG: HNH endonuclease [Thermodesulfovibrionales bacterium]|nr:HNH endonuclease [Thermodesulfovibrionales bacterium]
MKKRQEEVESNYFGQIGFVSPVSETEIKREKLIAQKLRATAWWKRKLSQSRCYYCNRVIPSKELTMDHVIPLIRGGKSTKNNLVTACKECNSKKKYLLPTEWQDYLNYLNNHLDD